MGPVKCPKCGRPDLFIEMDPTFQKVVSIVCHSCGGKFKKSDIAKDQKPCESKDKSE